MTKILVGADPEIFAKKEGKLVSAYGLLTGTKHAPQIVDKGAVQIDGMALEFNINPAANEQEFLTNIETVMSIMQKMSGAEFAIQPVADFGEEYMKTQPKEALELGCDPDFNAWNVAVNPRPNGDRPFRTAAGHIHIGFCDDGEPENMFYLEYVSEFVRELDFYLGLPSLFLDNHADSSRRRELYGKAGAFRPKVYGVEYRTLSNFWLASKELQKWAYNSTVNAWEAFSSGKVLAKKYGDIQSIINSSNKEAAKKIIDEEGLMNV